MTVGKIIFNEDSHERWHVLAKAIDFYLAVLDFDNQLRDMRKYGDVNTIDTKVARELLRQCLDEKDVHLGMLS